MTTDTILGLLVDANPDDASPAAAAARQAKRDLRPKLFDIMLGHHDVVQANERKGLPAEVKNIAAARAHLADPIKMPDQWGIENKVLALLATTPWKDHFAKPDVAQVIRNIIRQHTADVMHIERRWHHDRLQAKGA